MLGFLSLRRRLRSHRRLVRGMALIVGLAASAVAFGGSAAAIDLVVPTPPVVGPVACVSEQTVEGQVGSPVGDLPPCLEATVSVASTELLPALRAGATATPKRPQPGEPLDLEVSVRNDGGDLTISGELVAENSAEVEGTIVAWHSYVEYYVPAELRWVPLAGMAGARAGFSPRKAPKIATGLTFAPSAPRGTGVVAPPGSEQIIGTRIPLASLTAPSRAVWDYRASVALTPAQVELLLDAERASKVRHVVHFEMAVQRSGSEQIETRTAAVPFAKQVRTQSPIARDVRIWNRWVVIERLARSSIRIEVEAMVTAVTSTGVQILRRGLYPEFFEADLVVLSVGVRPENDLARELEGGGKVVYSVGDCAAIGQVDQAVASGFRVAREI